MSAGLRARQPGDRSGPSTSRAIACTASKSPGEAIGKPASMTSTPSRASWCAISSFSVVFSEMPGDCSPSRSVVSKISTRFGSMVVVIPSSRSPTASPRVVCGFAAASALFPPEGEEKKAKVEQERHVGRSVPAHARTAIGRRISPRVCARRSPAARREVQQPVRRRADERTLDRSFAVGADDDVARVVTGRRPRPGTCAGRPYDELVAPH